ncbi:MAG: VOC family protein [Nocardioidaceae bacterium]|nr:VOC family protein [Nocardioidaceae bacterium]
MEQQPPVVRLHSLRSVQLRVPDVATCTDFYGEVWGLSVVERDRGEAWLRGTGPNHHVLQLSQSERNALGRISFAVRTPAEVDEAARRLVARGVPLLREPGPLEDPAAGYGLELVDPEGRRIELSSDTHAVTPMSRDLPRPVGVTHVVLNTVDIDRAVAFYTEVLGMRVSDWSEHQMAFLRCNTDHHSIAFNQAAWTSVNHVAYEMTSIDHFMRGIGSLQRHGVLPLWGPGRHGPGNNTFGYFADPAGLVCEYTSDVAQVVEDQWLCRVWRRVPELSDLWGTAGPPSRQVREHMAGVEDRGALEHGALEHGDRLGVIS